MNEYRSLFYELEYINDILKEANVEFEFYKNKFCSKKQVNVGQLNQKHSKRVKKIFSPAPAVVKEIIKKEKQSRYDAKKLFRQIARKFHPDTLPLNDARAEEYEDIFKSASAAIDEGNWGQLFDIADQHGLDLEDYDSINNSLKEEIFIIRKQINNKKTTYAWLLYHCESDEQKDKLIKQFLNHIYVDYRNST